MAQVADHLLQSQSPPPPLNETKTTETYGTSALSPVAESKAVAKQTASGATQNE